MVSEPEKSHRIPTLVLGGCFTLLVLTTFLRMATPLEILLLLFGLGLFWLPGYLTCRHLLGFNPIRSGGGLFLSLLIGIVLSTLAAIFGGLILGFHPPVTIGAVAVLVLVILGIRRFRPVPEKPLATGLDWSRKDWPLFFILAILLILSVLIPLSTVGLETPQGIAYPCFFNLDLFKNMAHTAAVSHGELPPQNPYFYGEKLHYYWFYFILPAFLHQLSPAGFSTKGLLLSYGLFVDLLFLGLLFSLVRVFVGNRVVLFVVCFLGLFASSFEGLFALVRASSGLTFALPVNVEGMRLPALRFPQLHPHLEGFYRYFLYIQVALFGLCGFLSIILLNHFSRTSDGATCRHLVLIGVLLAALPCFSLVMGVLAFLWWVVYWLLLSLKPKWLLLIPIGLVLLLSPFYSRLEVFSSSIPLLTISQPKLLWSSLLHLVWEFGPIFLLGVPGIFLLFRDTNRVPRLAAFSLGIVGLVPLLVLTEKDVLLQGRPGLVAAWGGYLFHISVLTGLSIRVFLILCSGVFLERCFHFWGKRLVAMTGLSLLILTGLPTTLVDMSFHSQHHNPFTTTYLSPADLEANQWIRENLPENAVVQSASEYPGALGYLGLTDYSPIVVFGERSVACGDLGHVEIYVPDQGEVERKRALAEELFTTEYEERALAIAYGLRVGWLYVGREEMSQYGVDRERIPGIFEEVYSHNGVSIFRADPGPYKSRYLELDLSGIANSDYHLNVFVPGFREGRNSFPGLRSGVILWWDVPLRILPDLRTSGNWSAIDLSQPGESTEVLVKEEMLRDIYVAIAVTGLQEREEPTRFLSLRVDYRDGNSQVMFFSGGSKGIFSDSETALDSLHQQGDIVWESNSFGFTQRIRGLRAPLSQPEVPVQRIALSGLQPEQGFSGFGLAVLAITGKRTSK